jgi:hypothetical protein
VASSGLCRLGRTKSTSTEVEDFFFASSEARTLPKVRFATFSFHLLSSLTFPSIFLNKNRPQLLGSVPFYVALIYVALIYVALICVALI